MRKQTIAAKILTAICIMIMLMTAGGVFEKAYACRKGCNPAPTARSYIHPSPNAPPLNRLPQPQPPGFPYYWHNRDAVKSFNESGLTIEQIKPLSNSDYSSLPARARDDTRFSNSALSDDITGCILSFIKEDNLKKIQDHYLKLNENGELHTWSFVKDNILLVLTGNVPEERARQYEKALYEIKRHVDSKETKK